MKTLPGKYSLHGLLYATNAGLLEVALGNGERAHGSIYHQDWKMIHASHANLPIVNKELGHAIRLGRQPMENTGSTQDLSWSSGKRPFTAYVES